MNLSFEKLVGAGNDFVFLNPIPQLESINLQELTIKLCDRHNGIGADGLVYLEKKSPGKFIWQFFNSDGSSAEMCGNAARCAFLYIQTHYQLSSASMETLCGEVTGQVLGPEEVEVSWIIKDNILQKKSVKLNSGKTLEGFFINTGVPHFVLYNSETLTHKELLEIQQHPEFSPDETNVTLVDSLTDLNKTQSFERGVRDFTLACGTGVIASAFVLQHFAEAKEYQLHAPGGELRVRIFENQVFLRGPAKTIFKGELELT